MDTTMRNKSPMRARPMAELLFDIRVTLSLIAQNQPRSAIHQTNTNVEKIRPMTIAEINAINPFGKVPSPKRALQASKSKSKPWNSSLKVDKTKPLTANGRLKHTTAREKLTFQQENPREYTLLSRKGNQELTSRKLPVYTRTTMISSTANKPVHTLAANNNNDGTNLDNGLAIVEKHLVNNLLMTENALKVVKQLKINEYNQKLRREKAQTMVDNKNNEETNEKKTEDGKETFVGNVPKVSKVKLSSYKIPRKSSSLRKGLLCKSISDGMATQNKNTDRALKHCMQIKSQMTFLNTPLTKHRQIDNPDTPAVTSFNLRKQLDKLYNE